MTYDTTRPHNPSTSTGNAPKKKGAKDFFLWLLSKMKWALIIGGGFFVFLNIQPYIRIVELMLESVTEWALIDFIARLPVISWVVNFFGSIITSLLGIGLWVIVQFFELLPHLLERNRPQIKLLIDGLERLSKLTESDTDDQMVQRLKHRYNTLPNRLINKARWVQVFVYVFDLLLCLWAFPPLRGGIESLSLFLMAPSWQDIDVQNALTCIATLGAVELVYHGWNWLDNMVKMFGRVETTPLK